MSFRPGGGGQNVSYIEGWKALNLANEIFGFNGWSSEVVNIQVDFLDSLGSGRVSLGLSVVVRITIRDGTFHEDFGYGFLENAKNKAVAFEKCKKEAFTDGLKRCLRCFGNVLGNCLYDKTILAKMQKVKLSPPELESNDFHRDPLFAKQELARRRMHNSTSKVSLRNNDLPANPTSTAGTSSAHNPSIGVVVSSTNGSNELHLNGQEQSSSVVVSNGIAKATSSIAAQVPKSVQSITSGRPLTPVELRNYDLDDFDDLFVFSDDLPLDTEKDLANGDANKDDGELRTEIDSVLMEEVQGSTVNHNSEESGAEKLPAQVFFTSSKKALDLQKTPSKTIVPIYDHKFVAEGVKRSVDPTKSAKVRRADLPSPYTPSQINSARGSSMSLPGVGKRQLGLPPSQRVQSKRLKESEQGKENTES